MKSGENVVKWNKCRLGDVCDLNKNNYASTDNWPYINYLDTGNITENKVESIIKLNVATDKIPSRAKRKVSADDIIYSTVRPNHRHFGIIKRPLANMLVSTGFAVISARPDKVVSDFLYYYLTQNSIVEALHIIAEHSTSAYPSIKPSDIENLVLVLPPLQEQKAIADTLSCLDDKIGLNNRINKTLGEMAQAIFKSWFVDFEPFQDGEFEDSELGPLPKGWRVGPVEELCEIQIGGDWGKDANLPGLVPVICLRGTDLQKIKETGYSEEAPQRWVKPSSIDNRALTNHDIIIGGSGLGPVGRSICFDDTIEQLYPHPVTYSNFCKRVKAYSRSYAIYIEQIIEMLYVRGDLKRNYVNGTSVPNLDLQGLMKHRVVIPPENVVSKFAALKQRIFKLKCSGENPQLARVRDTLLPKLMSGEIRVPIEEVQ